MPRTRALPYPVSLSQHSVHPTMAMQQLSSKPRTVQSRKQSPRRLSSKANRHGTAVAAADPKIFIGGATLASLALGRFVALPYQRAQSAKQVPKQNGVDYVSAGDNRAKEVGPLVSSRNDPASFKLVDVLAWGSIGHIVGFTALVLANNP